MSIIQVTGAAKSGKSTVAAALRSYWISQGRGVLLVDAGNAEAGSIDLLNKIAAGEAIEEGTPVEKVRWKNDPVIILVGDQRERMTEFEKLVPGFATKFGNKVYKISTGGAA